MMPELAPEAGVTEALKASDPMEMGGFDEHLQGAGGGSDSRGADLRITEHFARGGQFWSFFPTEAEQITAIEEVESAQAPLRFFRFSGALLISCRGLGGNETMVIAAALFQKQKPGDVAAAAKHLPRRQRLQNPGGRVSAWYAVTASTSPRQERGVCAHRMVIAWQDAAVRISQLMDSGAYASNVEFAEAGQHERMQIARAPLVSENTT